jgi:hypothetical protein
MGTFAAISPSFVIGVNAQGETYDYGMEQKYSNYEQDYEMNSYDKKSYEQESYGKDKDKSKDSKSDLIKKLKCNNINANLNSVDANFGGPVEDDTNGAAEGGASEALSAQGGEPISANGLMNGASNGDRSFVDRENDFAFVCINNNNNTIIEEPTELLTCEDCFSADNTLQEIVEDFLVTMELGLSFVVIFGPDDVETLNIPLDVDTIEQLCPLLEGHSDVLVEGLILSMVEEQTGSITGFESSIDALIECLLEAGIIVDRESPGPIFDNGIASANVECTGDQICVLRP